MNDKKITLHVSFYIDEDSERLNWEFLRHGEPMPTPHGMETGLLEFEDQYDISLKVTVNSRNDCTATVHIIETCLITRPILFSQRELPKSPGTYPYPSPFFDPDLKAWEEKPQGATSDFGTSRHEPEGILAGNSWIAPIKLTCRNKGRWKTSFVMTVAIDPESPSDARQFRVFSFDPETQVGTGAIPAK